MRPRASPDRSCGRIPASGRVQCRRSRSLDGEAACRLRRGNPGSADRSSLKGERDGCAYAQEIFGPVAPVVGFSDLDEAVALANGTAYGLSVGILTRDVMKGPELAERIPQYPF